MSVTHHSRRDFEWKVQNILSKESIYGIGNEGKVYVRLIDVRLSEVHDDRNYLKHADIETCRLRSMRDDL